MFQVISLKMWHHPLFSVVNADFAVAIATHLVSIGFSVLKISRFG